MSKGGRKNLPGIRPVAAMKDVGWGLKRLLGRNQRGRGEANKEKAEAAEAEAEAEAGEVEVEGGKKASTERPRLTAAGASMFGRFRHPVRLQHVAVIRAIAVLAEISASNNHANRLIKSMKY